LIQLVTELKGLQLHPQLRKASVGGWSVTADKQDLFSASMKSFSTAAQAWFATFWVFSIEYPPFISKTYLFIEKVLLHQGSGKAPAVVTKWANRLVRN